MSEERHHVHIGETERAPAQPFIVVTPEDMAVFRESRVWLALQQRCRYGMQLWESRLLSIHTSPEERTYYSAQIATMRQVWAELGQIAVVDELPETQREIEDALRDELKGIL